MGLVNRVVAHKDRLPPRWRLPIASCATRRVLLPASSGRSRGLNASIHEGLEIDSGQFGRAVATRDIDEHWTPERPVVTRPSDVSVSACAGTAKPSGRCFARSSRDMSHNLHSTPLSTGTLTSSRSRSLYEEENPNAKRRNGHDFQDG